MEGNDTTTTTTSSFSPPPYSSSSSSSPPLSGQSLPLPAQPSPPVIVSPCAACKILRRRCIDKCVLAPYFPPTEPLKFTTAHRVFGASNIIKFLQELPESHRADAVSSMVYEANARIRDPVYGCAGAICHLQKQVSELQSQLAKAQGELINMQSQQANLVAIICMEMAHSQQVSSPPPQLAENYFPTNPNLFQTNNTGFLDDGNNLGSSWEQLWT
ncbi:LOB domain-containing protein 1-like [Tasmannia lanceolata]|uniref:LOB domain-containing protein 1-like n=1 Tax=Tasmannia lanceolata TaxID=3420 RepID=UPI004064A6C8